jgi:arylsulfatase A-like enzyme
LDSWLNELFVKLEQAGLYDNMTVIIHGDHGSRINLKHDPWANIASEMSTQDFLTNYAVFLAIKKPHEQTGSVNEIQGSLKNIIQAELIDHKSFSGEDEAFVYFKKKKGRTQMAKVPMVKR